MKKFPWYYLRRYYVKLSGTPMMRFILSNRIFVGLIKELGAKIQDCACAHTTHVRLLIHHNHIVTKWVFGVLPKLVHLLIPAGTALWRIRWWAGSRESLTELGRNDPRKLFDLLPLIRLKWSMSEKFE